MKVNNISGIIPDLKKTLTVGNAEGEKFGNVLSDFIGQVNQSQIEAGKITEDFIAGKNNVEIHDVMIAGEKAKTSFELLMEIRNKTIDMYKELTRMQI